MEDEMPTPKRGSSPHESQPKMRKLDEDGEDLQSKTSPASNNNRALIKTGSAWEKHAAPRPKKKLSPEGANKPARSSIQSSPPKDSSKTISGPPLKKAKLLKATSASCGEAHSQKANSKAPLKRTASTESEDELSSDSSKTDLFRERDDGDKARCIRQYSNRVKAKRKAEETSSDPQEMSQGSPSGSADPVQMDHNYGRFSDTSSTHSQGDDEKKEVDAEGEKQEILIHATQERLTETAVSGTETKHEELTNAENQTCTDAGASCRDITDCVTTAAADADGITPEVGENERKDAAESIKSQKDADNEAPAAPVETLCSGKRETETNPDCDGRTESAAPCQADESREAELKETMEPVPKETSPDTKCAEGVQEGIEAEGVSAAVSNKTHPESQKEEHLPPVRSPDTQSDLSFKIQVTFKEESKAEHLQHGVSHQVPDTIAITNSCDGVNRIVRKAEKHLGDGERKEVPAVAAPVCVAALQASQAVDSCTEAATTPGCEATHGQDRTLPNAAAVASQSEETPKQVPDSAVEEEVQNHASHTTENPTEVTEKMTVECASAPNGQLETDARASAASEPEVSSEAVAVEKQSQKMQQATENATDISADLSEDGVSNINTNENKENLESTAGPEAETQTATPDTSSSTPAVEQQSSEHVGDDGELISDMSTESHQEISSENSDTKENTMQFEGSTVPERQSIATPWMSASPSAVESIGNASVEAEVQKHAVENCQSSSDEARVEVDSASNVIPAIEAQDWNSRDAKEQATGASDDAPEGLKPPTGDDHGSSNREHDMAALPEEAPALTATVETQMQSCQDQEEVSSQEHLFIASSESVEKKEDEVATERVDVAESQMDSATPEVASQDTEVHKDLLAASCVEVQASPQSADVLDAQSNMETTTEEVCEASPETEKQKQPQEAVEEPGVASSSVVHDVPPVENPESEENMQTEPGPEHVQEAVDVRSGSIEGPDSALAEETVRHVSGEVKEEAAALSFDNDVGSSEGAAGGDVVVFVCEERTASDAVVQATEEQVRAISQSEVEVYQNQVVYEPISSPESDGGRDVPTASENHAGASLLDAPVSETQQMEGDSATREENREIPPRQAQNDQQAACVSDSREAATEDVPESRLSAQLEQGGDAASADVKQVAVISSSDDVNVPDGRSEDAAAAAEKTGSNGLPDCAHVSEQVQLHSSLQEVADVPTTTTTTATASGQIPDSTSEEFVILEPVPQSEIPFDIVTQAAAESGLVAEDLSVQEDMEVEHQAVMNGSQQVVPPEDEVQQRQTTGAAEETTASKALDQETSSHLDQQTSGHLSDVTPEMETAPCAVQAKNDTLAAENSAGNVDLPEVQILEETEIGREIVVAEEDNVEDGEVTMIEKPQEAPTKQPEEKAAEKNKDAGAAADSKEDGAKAPEPEKPKKQEMNTQARTKARLAALAEQKAAASKRSANRQQLNLLALCQEIAEDIATDSMLLKRIEEEKQAAAAAAALAASKAEAAKKEPPPESEQEAEAAPAPTAAGPEECASAASETPAEEAAPAEPSASDPAEARPAAETPKRRFFISQVSVPLKAHEKKKLTRYQRLRQVELQREKMSWARVKKLKSDQANQMFSDMEWQAPLAALPPLTPLPPPSASTVSKTQPASPASGSKPAEVPKDDAAKAEPSKSEPTKTETSKTEPTKPEPARTEPIKPEPAKTEATESPAPEVRRSTRQSKSQTPKATPPPPPPAQKTTRSGGKRSLPAVPPPMPNGLNAEKPKPVEYKPYRPRPKYSFDDFELDDDPVPVAPARPQQRAAQPGRPSPAAQTKAAASSPQVSNQARPRAQAAPAAQTPAQGSPAAAAQQKAAGASPRVALPPKAQLKSPAVTQSKMLPVSAQSKPGNPQTGAAQPKQAAPAAAQPPRSATPAAPLPPKTTSSGDGKSKDEASTPSDQCSKASQNSEEKPAVTDVAPSSENKAEAVKQEAKTLEKPAQDRAAKPQNGRTPLSDASLQKEVKKLKEADKDGTQTIIDAGQKHFGAVACSVCGMLYSAANPEDESQHLLFHNQFISAVKYVGWKKERILAEYPDGKIILVLPDDPKYALKKVEEIREVVDSDLGFQQVETKCPSQTKTFLFISNDKKVGGCLIAEHIQEGYRVIEEPVPDGSEGEKVMFERQRAWCCSTTPEPAICGISRIWVVSMMRRQGIASRMLECLRNNFVYGSYLSKDEIAFSDPTPDGKLFATHYFGTSQFLVYNFVSGTHASQPKADAV